MIRARIGYLARRSGIEEAVVSSSIARLVFRKGAEVADTLPGSSKFTVTLEKTGRILLSLSVRGLSREEGTDRILDLMRLVAPG